MLCLLWGHPCSCEQPLTCAVFVSPVSSLVGKLALGGILLWLALHQVKDFVHISQGETLRQTQNNLTILKEPLIAAHWGGGAWKGHYQ